MQHTQNPTHLYLDKHSNDLDIGQWCNTQNPALWTTFVLDKHTNYLDIGHWDCQHHFLPRLHLTPPPCHNFSFFLQQAETSHQFSYILPLILSLWKWKYNAISFYNILLEYIWVLFYSFSHSCNHYFASSNQLSVEFFFYFHYKLYCD